MDFDATLAVLDELDEELPALPLTLAAVATTRAPTNPSTGTATTAPPPPSVAPPPSGDAADRGVDAERLLEKLLLSYHRQLSVRTLQDRARQAPKVQQTLNHPRPAPKMTSRMWRRAEMEYPRMQVEELEAEELQQLEQGSRGSGGGGDNGRGRSSTLVSGSRSRGTNSTNSTPRRRQRRRRRSL